MDTDTKLAVTFTFLLCLNSIKIRVRYEALPHDTKSLPTLT